MLCYNALSSFQICVSLENEEKAFVRMGSPSIVQVEYFQLIFLLGNFEKFF